MTIPDLINLAVSNVWLVAVVALSATARFMLAPRQSLAEWLRGVVFASFIALLSYYISHAYLLSSNWEMVVIAVSSFFAENLLRGFITLGDQFARDPFIIFAWLDRLREKNGKT